MSKVMNVAEIFGENVFNDSVMQERLPKEIYIELARISTEIRDYSSAKEYMKIAEELLLPIRIFFSSS